MARIEFAWELGPGTGHGATLLPGAAAGQARRPHLAVLLPGPPPGADLAGAAGIPRVGAADGRVRRACTPVLPGHGVRPRGSMGGLFAGRAMLLTYPELDIYPERGPCDYYGIPDSGEGKAVPDWPAGSGPRLFAYLYSYFKGLDPLLAAVAASRSPALVFCRGIDPKLREKYDGGSIRFSPEPMSGSKVDREST